MKENLIFTRMSVRGKERVKDELRFALMAVKLRKYVAQYQNQSTDSAQLSKKMVPIIKTLITEPFLTYF